MADAKCVPTFWEPLFNNTTWTTNFPKCKNSKQYRKIYLRFLSRLSKIGKDYVQPCTKMKVSVANRDRNSQPGQLKLYFLYNQDVYKEIVNTRAFTVETLLGQIGGFVGIPINIFRSHKTQHKHRANLSLLISIIFLFRHFSRILPTKCARISCNHDIHNL